jgi:hypothetical protein
VVLVLAAVGFLLDVQMRAAHHEPWHEAARWVEVNLPEDAVIAMTDCGLFGYFCGRRTVNLDGVINGYAYQEALRDQRLSEFLARAGVTHVASYKVEYENGRYVTHLPARLYRGIGSAIRASRSAELYRSRAYRDALHREEDIHFAVWDIRSVEVIDDASRVEWRRRD